MMLHFGTVPRRREMAEMCLTAMPTAFGGLSSLRHIERRINAGICVDNIGFIGIDGRA